MKIFKYFIDERKSENTFEVNNGYKILSVQVKLGRPVIWIAQENDGKKLNVTFKTVCTGEIFDDEGWEYSGTFQLLDGEYVGHVFEKLSK